MWLEQIDLTTIARILVDSGYDNLDFFPWVGLCPNVIALDKNYFILSDTSLNIFMRNDSDVYILEILRIYRFAWRF